MNATWSPSASAQPQQAPSAADLESARETFKQAMIQRQGGDVQGSLDKFKAAHALGQTPVTGVELGRTEMQLGQLVEAREVFLSIARIPVAPDEGEKSTAARTEAAQLADDLQKRIPTLMVKVTTPAPNQTPHVSVDGVDVPAVALAAPRKLNPGKHDVVAKLEGGPEEKASVELKEGETREVALAVKPAGPGGAETPQKPAVETGETHMNPLVYIGFGVGGAGLVVGSVTGVLAIKKANSVSSSCNGTSCPPSVKSDVTSGRTMATISTISFIVAGVGAAVGVYGLLTPIHSEKSGARTSLVVTPTFTGFDGSF